MSLKSPKETINYTEDFESTSNYKTNLNISTRSRRNEASNRGGLSSNELKSKLIQVVKNKGIYDIMKVKMFENKLLNIAINQ
jgi:hypothetical protein